METGFERRAEQRRRTLLTGHIEFLHRSAFDCVIRNVSETGAKIACEQFVGLPEIFDLVFVKDEKRRRVRTIWRGDGAVGVSFIGDGEYRNVLAFGPSGAPA